jgi:hypothetical protein
MISLWGRGLQGGWNEARNGTALLSCPLGVVYGFVRLLELKYAGHQGRSPAAHSHGRPHSAPHSAQRALHYNTTCFTRVGPAPQQVSFLLTYLWALGLYFYSLALHQKRCVVEAVVKGAERQSSSLQCAEADVRNRCLQAAGNMHSPNSLPMLRPRPQPQQDDSSPLKGSLVRCAAPRV